MCHFFFDDLNLTVLYFICRDWQSWVELRLFASLERSMALRPITGSPAAAFYRMKRIQRTQRRNQEERVSMKLSSGSPTTCWMTGSNCQTADLQTSILRVKSSTSSQVTWTLMLTLTQDSMVRRDICSVRSLLEFSTPLLSSLLDSLQRTMRLMKSSMLMNSSSPRPRNWRTLKDGAMFRSRFLWLVDAPTKSLKIPVRMALKLPWQP